MAVKDAINGYRLFLGREPESERVVNDKAGFPLPKMLGSFAGSREFSDRVVMPLASGYPLPHFRVSALPSPDIATWASEALPLTAATRAKLPQAHTWRHLLTLIVLDSEFIAKLGRSLPEQQLASLRRRQTELSKTNEREIAGAVDDIAMFEIRGWAANILSLREPLTLEFFLDNLFIGTAPTGLLRRDIQEKLGGDGNYGFSFNVPAAHHADLQVERLLTVRDATSHLPIAVPTRMRVGQADAMDSLFRLKREVEVVGASLERLQAALPSVLSDTEYPLSMYDAYQRAARKALHENRDRLSAETFAVTPTFSVVIVTSGETSAGFIPSINSVRRQLYRHWECVVCAAAQHHEITVLLETLCSGDNRIKAVPVPSGATSVNAVNLGVGRATGEYVLVLREGDLLAEDALLEITRALQENPASLLYFDEDIFERDGVRARYLAPVLKTDFDYDHLLSRNYIENAFACRKDLFLELRGFSLKAGQATEYDFILRAVEKIAPHGICHIQRILYHRRFDLLEQAGETNGRESGPRLACVNAHLKRTGASAVAEPHSDPLGGPWPRSQRIVWALGEPAPAISIIVPTRDRADLLGPCLESVLETRRHYPGRVDVLVIDNESVEPETHAVFARAGQEENVSIIPYASAFNWSAINNLAARRATGDILLFLNNDTRVLSEDWLRELASHIVRPEVGAVGARLLYEDGTIQHAGVVLGGRAVHEGIGLRPGDGGYQGRTVLQRNCSAVTGACLATRKSVFVDLGGFDENHLKVAFNDIDYCLKVRAAGLCVIYTPFATLYHFESKSRGLDDDFSKRLRSQGEIGIMRSRWGDAVENDPFYNARFNRTGRPFTRLRPPQLLTSTRTPVREDEELWEYE